MDENSRSDDSFSFDDAIDTGYSKRRRVKTTRFECDVLDIEEQRLIQQAIKNSKRDKKRIEYDIPEAPTYYPTVEEFKDPLGYIKKISKEAKMYGLCKIVPPDAWKPSCQIQVDPDSSIEFPTRHQEIHRLQESVGFDEGSNYTISTYKAMSDLFYKEWSEKYYNGQEVLSYADLERDYWSMVDTRSKSATVEYANDLEIEKFKSGFVKLEEMPKSYTGVESMDCDDMFSTDYYSRCGWNLLNIPKHQDSILKFLDTPINGVNVPWVYIGMLFASFCWHNEDNYLYSINYSHFGDIKQWYGVPGSEAKKFEKVVRDFLLELFNESPDLLHHMTTQISPSLLYGNGVPVYQVKQEPRSFVITFPKSFHCGFSYGFNCGEAVNFALEDWLEYGVEAAERYRLFARYSVFSYDRLLFTLLRNLSTLSSYAKLKVALSAVKILDEEIEARPYILDQGIRDISSFVTLPPNKFDTIDKQALDFDDLRCCHICKHFCIFTAIACECDRNIVSCIRHSGLLCKCANARKFMLVWADNHEVTSMKKELDVLVPPTTNVVIKSEINPKSFAHDMIFNSNKQII